MPHHHDQERSAKYSGSDPLLKSRRESPSLTALWLKSPRRLTGAQSVGFSILSVCFIFVALFEGQDLVEQLRDNNVFMALVSVVIGAGALYLGVRGFINVFRSR